MKLLTLIFSIYILAMPCIPCMGTDDCEKDAQTSLQQAGNSQQHSDETETCNPFCSCTCCAHNFTATLQLGKIISPKITSAQKQQYLHNNIFLPSDFYGNIWQPPRLS